MKGHFSNLGNMQVDRLTSVETINKIMQIVRDVYTQNEELFKQKKQPTLLFFSPPHDFFTLKLSITPVSENSTETYRITFSFVDNASQELRSFTFDNITLVNSIYALEHDDSINDIKEWLINMRDEKPTYKTVCISAHSNTPMGIIIDLKQLLRENYALRVSHSAK